MTHPEKWTFDWFYNRLKPHKGDVYRPGQALPEPGYETATGRRLYTVQQIRARETLAEDRAWRLADAYATNLIETEGVRHGDAWTYFFSHEQQAEDLEVDESISHLVYRELATVQEIEDGTVVVVMQP